MRCIQSSVWQFRMVREVNGAFVLRMMVADCPRVLSISENISADQSCVTDQGRGT